MDKKNEKLLMEAEQVYGLKSYLEKKIIDAIEIKPILESLYLVPEKEIAAYLFNVGNNLETQNPKIEIGIYSNEGYDLKTYSTKCTLGFGMGYAIEVYDTIKIKRIEGNKVKVKVTNEDWFIGLKKNAIEETLTLGKYKHGQD
ncbi:MAG: hypothetical protein U9R34_06595 [Nanoarchaeota archaeon]|nr:hypothetical protein [Nanoarchaeota archaeon]